MRKVTVIGVGSLGSCIAYETANRGLVDELVLVDVYRELAEGNAADIAQALAFRSNVEVKAGDYGDAEGSQVIIVTAGKPRTPDMKSRMELLEVNKKIIGSVASELKKTTGEPIIVTLTNPVDIMNYVMWKDTGLERRRVLGSAGMLDSARFRTVLSGKYQTSILDVDAYVIGEHGDNQTPVFSQARIKGQKRTFGKNERSEILKRLRRSALNVISKKGATIFAPANNTANLIQTILNDEKKTAVCSVVLDGEYGLKDVSMGVPATIGRNGVEKILEWKLKEEEKSSFYRGAEHLKAMIKAVC
ncbi:MAG: malate dehydrogenase [Candidatus Bathyarchaeota archaeon]|nr:malate dehydrogenase [Candidatus Bathyarchaeota archaeon]